MGKDRVKVRVLVRVLVRVIWTGLGIRNQNHINAIFEAI